jgi:ATP-dependent DNA ligase
VLPRPRNLRGFVAPCLPTKAPKPPSLHEIKHDGFRIIARKDGARVKLYRFHHACRMGLEGIVSKRKDSTYRSGRSPDRLKMKNPACKCDWKAAYHRDELIASHGRGVSHAKSAQ